MKKYYKVVTKINGKFYSPFSTIKAEYKEGEYIKGDFPLFIFCSLEYAQRFAHFLVDNEYIFKCKTKRVRQVYNIVYFPFLNSETMRKFWNGTIESEKTMISPPGTFIADEVKLTHEIR